jgi:hypothetical protein
MNTPMLELTNDSLAWAIARDLEERLEANGWTVGEPFSSGNVDGGWIIEGEQDGRKSTSRSASPASRSTARSGKRVALRRGVCTRRGWSSRADSWTMCTGFRWRSLLFLNDATSGDGAQEYAVIREGVDGSEQVESLTMSWGITLEDFAKIVEQLDADPDEYWDAIAAVTRVPFEPNLNHPEGSCAHCA